MAGGKLLALLLCLTAPLFALAWRELTAEGTTQAGCVCQANWTHYYTANESVVVSGCANPDSDPKGPWCPVDPVGCQNHYGSYTWLATKIDYDYCSPVRAVTKKGCLCKAVSMNRADGKPYRDSCLLGNKGTSFCRVDKRTCSTATDDNPEAYGVCKWVEETAGVPDGEPTTQGGCTCASDWSYGFDHTRSGQFGPYQGCSNEDGDPKGPWCVVSPVDCPSAYGTFKDITWNKDVYYAYCGAINEVTQAGCMCKAVWGGGKLQDRCANPDNKPGKWCEIMPGTCKTAPFNETWDYCGSIPPGLIAPTSDNFSSAAPGPTPTPITLFLNGSSTAAAPAAAASAGKRSSSGVNKVALLVPLLTGLAALVTICYTLYKCHKKRQFFQWTSNIKMSQLAQQASDGSRGPGRPFLRVTKNLDRSETLTYGPIASKNTV